MPIRFVARTIRGYLDHPVALTLLALPFVLGLGRSNPSPFWLSIATGVAAFGLTVFTNHKTGIVRVIPSSVHLAVDALVGVTFVAAPFVLGFAGLDAVYYWGLGGTVLVVCLLHTAEQNALTGMAVG